MTIKAFPAEYTTPLHPSDHGINKLVVYRCLVYIMKYIVKNKLIFTIHRR